MALPSAGAPALKYGDVNTEITSPGEVKELTDKNKEVINKNVKIIKEENYEFILQSVPE